MFHSTVSTPSPTSAPKDGNKVCVTHYYYSVHTCNCHTLACYMHVTGIAISVIITSDD